MKEYMAWIEDPDKIKGEKELTLTLRDLAPGREKYRARKVVAIVSPKSMPQSDILRVRYENGRLIPEPWAIKIVREVEDFYAVRPYSGILD